MSNLFDPVPVNTATADVPAQPNAMVHVTASDPNAVKLTSKIASMTPQERSLFENTKRNIVAGDFGSISTYAQGTNSIAGGVVDSILKAAGSSDLDNIGGGVNKILITAKKIDAKQLTQAGPTNWFKRMLPWIFVTKELLAAKFNSLGKQIDGYAKEIEANLKTSQDSIGIMETMGQECLQKYKFLEVSIMAGYARVHELTDEYEAEKAKLAAMRPEDIDPLQTQALQAKHQFIDTLEKQVSAQEQHQQVLYLQMPQLGMMIKNAVDSCTEFRQIIDLTIPLWKNQFAQALILEQQKKANEIIKDNKDFTNAMLKANADNLKTSTLQIREQAARGLIDRETLEYVQSQFIQTVEGAVSIHTKAKESRAQLSQSIDKMRLEFKSSMTKATA